MPGFGGGGTDDGRKNGRLAVLGQDGSVCLAGIAARLELQLAATPVNFDSMDVEHVQSFVFDFSVGRTCSPASCRANAYRAGTQRGAGDFVVLIVIASGHLSALS